MIKEYDVSEKVITRLRAFRTVRRISSEQMARGISRQGYPLTRTALSALENGRSKIVPVDLTLAAMKYLGVGFGGLLEGPLCGACHDVPPPDTICRVCLRTIDKAGKLVNARGLL